MLKYFTKILPIISFVMALSFYQTSVSNRWIDSSLTYSYHPASHKFVCDGPCHQPHFIQIASFNSKIRLIQFLAEDEEEIRLKAKLLSNYFAHLILPKFHDISTYYAIFSNALGTPNYRTSPFGLLSSLPKYLLICVFRI